MVICLELDADLHMPQWMPLPLTVSCFSTIQIGFTFLVPAHLGSPGKKAVKRDTYSDTWLHIYTATAVLHMGWLAALGLLPTIFPAENL